MTCCDHERLAMDPNLQAAASALRDPLTHEEKSYRVTLRTPPSTGRPPRSGSRAPRTECPFWCAVARGERARIARHPPSFDVLRPRLACPGTSSGWKGKPWKSAVRNSCSWSSCSWSRWHLLLGCFGGHERPELVRRGVVIFAVAAFAARGGGSGP